MWVNSKLAIESACRAVEALLSGSTFLLSRNADAKYTTGRGYAEGLEEEAIRKGRSFKDDPMGKEAKAAVVRGITKDIREAVANGSQAIGWYSTHWNEAIEAIVKSTGWDELENKVDRLVFTAIMAVTSNGQKVMNNFKLAIQVYANYRATGNIDPSVISADRGDAIGAGLNKLDQLLKLRGPEDAVGFLLTERTVSDLRKMAKEADMPFTVKYLSNVRLPVAALVLGPKVGAFFANLSGMEGYLTMDRWFSRTIGRHRGDLIPTLKGLSEDVDEAEDMDAAEQLDSKGRPKKKKKKIGLARFKEMMGMVGVSDEDAMKAVTRLRKQYEAKGFENGTREEQAANTIWKRAFLEILDTPKNASDRSFMINAMRKAQGNLKRHGIALSIADMQAVLWYFEKELYAKATGVNRDLGISYKDAATRVVDDLLGTFTPQTESEFRGEEAAQQKREVARTKKFGKQGNFVINPEYKPSKKKPVYDNLPEDIDITDKVSAV